MSEGKFQPKNKKQQHARDCLIRLQKRLILNETNAQSFYTKFSTNTKKILDLTQIDALLKRKIFTELLENHTVEIMPTKTGSQKNLEEALKKINVVSICNQEEIKESNVDCLYIGWPYISGVIATENSETNNQYANLYRAPLLLWKVTIEKDNNLKYRIILDKDDEKIRPQINISLISRVSVINKKNADFKQVELDESDPMFAIKVIAVYEAAGIIFSDDEKAKIKSILKSPKPVEFEDPAASKPEYLQKINKTKHLVSNYAILGLFSFNNISLFHAYDEIINSEEGIAFYDKLSSMYSEEFITADDFKETDILQIDKLDYSQKQAINRAMTESLVIQGPPGTGKSQTITNIIANAITRGKRVLFVTEKYVAAQVVENRLLELNKFCLPLFDISDPNKKKNFYDRINVCFNELQSGNGVELNKMLSNNIEKEFKKIRAYEEFKKSDSHIRYLNFIKDFGQNFSEIDKQAHTYHNLISKYKTSKEFWDSINMYRHGIKFHAGVKKILKHYRLSIDEIVYLIDLSKKFEASEKFHHNDIPFYVIKRRIKDKYNFVNKHITIRRGRKTSYYINLLNVFKKISLDDIDFLAKYSGDKYVEIDQFIKSKGYLEFLKFDKQNFNETNFIFPNFEKLRRAVSFERKFKKILSFNKEFSIAKISKLLKQKETHDRTYAKLAVKSLIRNQLKASAEIQKDFSDLRNLAESSKTRNVSWAMERYKNAIQKCFPVIISSPDDASTAFGAKQNEFDYVIFDEASQITLERAIPILYLGKINIVSGDQRQLQPTDFFQGKLREEYEDTYNELQDNDVLSAEDFTDIEDSASLLSFTEKKFHKTMLTYHYRSQKRELIEFSNVAFYKNKLIVASKPNDNQPGIEVITLKNAVWNESTNKVEAEQVVEIVKKICATPNHGSIGIITFNATQKDYIDDLLFAVTDQKVRAELNRKNKNDGSDESIFVKNIENVQGDERDIIIFSNTYAKTATGKFAQFYGPINQKGGENRINVAISRAREKIYIVKSFESSAILRKGVVPKGKMVFGDYLEFCEQFDKLKTLNHPTIHEIFGRYNESKIINKKKDLAFEFASVFDEQVCNSLSKKINKKYEVVANVEQSGYKLDICVKDRASGAYVLAVKCDGYPYESSVSLKERDYYRQNYLEIRGWKFFRMTSKEWFRGDQKKIINKIISLL